MIMKFTVAQFYSVMVGVVPLYVAMLLGYGSLRWWKLVVPEQCVGIAQLNSYFLIPGYVFHVLAFNNPYTMGFQILAADFLSKVIPLCVLCTWASLYSAKAPKSFDWAISIFMLATLPNTVIVGIPLLQPMYGDVAVQGSICIISAQCLFWFNACILLFEVRAAHLHITADMIKAKVQLLECREIMSARGVSHAVVYPEVDQLEEEADTSFRLNIIGALSDHDLLPHSASYNPSRSSSFRSAAMVSPPAAAGTAQVPILKDDHSKCVVDGFLLLEMKERMNATNANISTEHEAMGEPPPAASTREPSISCYMNTKTQQPQSSEPANSCSIILSSDDSYCSDAGNCSTSLEIASAGPATPAFATKESDLGTLLATKREMAVDDVLFHEQYISSTLVETKEGAHGDCTESSFTARQQFESTTKLEEMKVQKRGSPEFIEHQLGRFSMLKQVCKRVLFRLLRLPLLYGSVLGFTYSLLASRWGFHMPRIVEASLQIMTNMTLGACMFLLGVFMASQPNLLPCGLWKTGGGMVIRFGVGPAIMAIASIAVGIRGNSLRFAITQAAVPQSILTFVLAKEYNVYPDIFATAVSFQTLIFLPFVLLYYILLEL